MNARQTLLWTPLEVCDLGHHPLLSSENEPARDHISLDTVCQASVFSSAFTVFLPLSHRTVAPLGALPRTPGFIALKPGSEGRIKRWCARSFRLPGPARALGSRPRVALSSRPAAHARRR